MDHVHEAPQEAEDQIIRELDVYLCKGTLPEGSKVQMKPGAGRLRMDVPLQAHGLNVNPDADPALKLQSLRLVSSPAALPTSFAIGAVRDGRLLLVPLDEALQLRPSLAHVDEAKQQASSGARKNGASGAADSAAPEEEEEKPSELQAVKVSVQRRETERQTEARLKSYSHHAKREDEEPWVPLKLYSADSNAAATVWGKLTSPPETAIDMSLSREAYLDSIVPGSGMADEAALDALGPDGAAAMDLGAPEAMLTAAHPPAPPIDQSRSVPAGAKPGLRKALGTLFKQHAVVDLPHVRAFLRRSPEPGAADAGLAGDSYLRDAVIELPHITGLRGRFAVSSRGEGRDDAFRRVILQILESRESFQRKDVVAAMKAAEVLWSDSVYHRVIKELCTSLNNTWTLRSGDIS